MLTEGNYALTGTITEFNQACLECFNKCYKKGFRKGLVTGVVGVVIGSYGAAAYKVWKDKKIEEAEEI